MLDNIALVESFAYAATMMGAPHPAMVFFDFRNAFPSVSHTWIFHVLTEMGLPAPLVQAIRLMYRDIVSDISFEGQEAEGFPISTGIKQGCPMSGTIFALAIDPFVRYLNTRVEVPTPLPSHPTNRSLPGAFDACHEDRPLSCAFADDIGTTTWNIIRELPVLLSRFS